MAMQTIQRLIINADDGFYSNNRDRGIVECFKSGKITDISLIMNGPIARHLHKARTKIGINCLYDYLTEFKIVPGLHLNITEGSPLLEGCTLIVDQNYEMLGKRGLPQKITSGELFNYTEVEKEIELQIQRFIALFKQPPSHVDGHQHAHILHGVNDRFAMMLRKYDVTFTRMPIESIPSRMTHHPSMPFFETVIMNAMRSMRTFKEYGLRYPRFIGLSLMSENLTLQNIGTALRDMEMVDIFNGDRDVYGHFTHCVLNNTVELMVHPGYVSLPQDRYSSLGADQFDQSNDRERELHILQSDVLAQMFKQRKLTFTTYSNLLK